MITPRGLRNGVHAIVDQTLYLKDESGELYYEQFLNKVDFMNLANLTWPAYVEMHIKGDWNNFKRFFGLKVLIREKGIPDELRIHMWPRISTASEEYANNMQIYEEVVLQNKHLSNQNTFQIDKDLTRTFPAKPSGTDGSDVNSSLNSEVTLAKLRYVLCAFSVAHPVIGYCQSMNFWSLVLLSVLDEQLTFWMMRAVVFHRLPKNYYTKTMKDIVRDSEVFKILVKEREFKLYQHCVNFDVDVSSFIPTWFLSVFCASLAPQSRLRVLDSFLYEGDKTLFRVAMALFQLNKQEILATRDGCKLIKLLSKLPKKARDVDVLMRTAFAFTLPPGWLKKTREAVASRRSLLEEDEESDSFTIPHPQSMLDVPPEYSLVFVHKIQPYFNSLVIVDNYMPKD